MKKRIQHLKIIYDCIFCLHTGSLFMSLGLVLIVPVVNIYTYFIGFPAGDVCDLGKGVVPDTYNNIGSVLIIIGFLVMNVDFYGLTRSLFQRCGLCSGDTNRQRLCQRVSR